MKRIVVMLCVLVLAGCALPVQVRSTSATATQPPAPSAAPTILEPTDTPVPPATATPAPLLPPQYTLLAQLDFGRHTLAVQEHILYANRSGEAIPDLLLVVDAMIYPGSFQFGSLTASAGPKVTQAGLDKTWLRASLDRPLNPGESIQLDLTYNLILPARTAVDGLRPMVFGWSDRQTNLVDWYPYLPPYQPGKGWQAHEPGYYGEHQVYEASDFSIDLQVTNAPASALVAASAPEQKNGDVRHYETKLARSFAISVGAMYQLKTRTVGNVTVLGYSFPEHAAAGERALQTAAESLQLFSRLYGPYEHSTLTVVEADFLDGMEYDGLFFLSNGFYNLSNGTPGDYLVAVAAHETSHQWWYGLVGNDQALEPWLDEALATYSEKLFYENLYPDGLKWWWAVRVNYYQPTGFVDDSIYNPHHVTQAYRAYRDAVYLNGAIFLDQLRTKVGDDAFFAFLKDYVAQNRHGIATAQGFFTLLRSHTQADIGPLLKKYFSQTY